MHNLSKKQLFLIYGFAVFLLSVKVFADYKFPVGLNEEQKSAWTSILNTFLPISGGSVTGNLIITNGTLTVKQGGGTWGIDAAGGQMNMGTNSGSGLFDFNVILQGAIDNVTHSRIGSFRSSSTVASFESAGSAQIVLDNNNNETGTSFTIRHNDYSNGPVLFSVADNGTTSITTKHTFYDTGYTNSGAIYVAGTSRLVGTTTIANGGGTDVNLNGRTVIGTTGSYINDSGMTSFTINSTNIGPGTSYTTNVTFSSLIAGSPVIPSVSIYIDGLAYFAYCTNSGSCLVQVRNLNPVSSVTTSNQTVYLRSFNPG